MLLIDGRLMVVHIGKYCPFLSASLPQTLRKCRDLFSYARRRSDEIEVRNSIDGMFYCSPDVSMKIDRYGCLVTTRKGRWLIPSAQRHDLCSAY